MRAVALTFPNGFEVAPHSHDWHQLVYAASGVVSVSTESGQWVVPPMHALAVAAGVHHALAMKGSVHLRTVYLPPRHRFPATTECEVVTVSPLLRELLLSIVDSGGLGSASEFDRIRLELLRHLLTTTAQGPAKLPVPSDPRARRVAQKVLRELGSTDPLATLCDGCGASRRTIERLFRAETGMTLGRWRQQARMLESLCWLGDGTSVTATAFAVGYRSPSAYVAAFRAVLGTTPAQYFRMEK